jgi:small neutral amino acid transporter SnatA (MarC family)
VFPSVISSTAVPVSSALISCSSDKGFQRAEVPLSVPPTATPSCTGPSELSSVMTLSFAEQSAQVYIHLGAYECTVCLNRSVLDPFLPLQLVGWGLLLYNFCQR